MPPKKHTMPRTRSRRFTGLKKSSVLPQPIRQGKPASSNALPARSQSGRGEGQLRWRRGGRRDAARRVPRGARGALRLTNGQQAGVEKEQDAQREEAAAQRHQQNANLDIVREVQQLHGASKRAGAAVERKRVRRGAAVRTDETPQPQMAKPAVSASKAAPTEKGAWVRAPQSRTAGR